MRKKKAAQVKEEFEALFEDGAKAAVAAESGALPNGCEERPEGNGDAAGGGDDHSSFSTLPSSLPASAPADAGPRVYIGPTVAKRGLFYGAVFSGEMPALWQEALDELPELARLIVPAQEAGRALRQMERRGTPAYEARSAVLCYL